MVEVIPVIKLEPGAVEAVRSFLAEKGIQNPVRIDLNFKGCCDSMLSLCVDTVHETDLTAECEGLKFIIDREIYGLTGEITISHVDEVASKGFVLTSQKPVSEWDGFGTCDIKS